MNPMVPKKNTKKKHTQVEEKYFQSTSSPQPKKVTILTHLGFLFKHKHSNNNNNNDNDNDNNNTMLRTAGCHFPTKALFHFCFSLCLGVQCYDVVWGFHINISPKKMWLRLQRLAISCHCGSPTTKHSSSTCVLAGFFCGHMAPWWWLGDTCVCQARLFFKGLVSYKNGRGKSKPQDHLTQTVAKL